MDMASALVVFIFEGVLFIMAVAMSGEPMRDDINEIMPRNSSISLISNHFFT